MCSSGSIGYWRSWCRVIWPRVVEREPPCRHLKKKRFDRLVSSRKPFGLETTFKGKMAKGKGDILSIGTVAWPTFLKSSISTGVHLIGNWEGLQAALHQGLVTKTPTRHRIHQYAIHWRSRTRSRRKPISSIGSFRHQK